MEYSIVPAWGKRRPDGAIHHLAHHSADVAACFLRLIEEPTFADRLRHSAARPLHSTEISRLAVLVFLHDVGKLNTGFQTKWMDPRPLGGPGHMREALGLLTANPAQAVRDALGIREIWSWGAATPGLLLAALAHHGRPLDPRREDQGCPDPRIWRPLLGYDPKAEAQVFGRALRAWFAPAFETGPDLPHAPALQHHFAGLVALADQIASREGHPLLGSFDPAYIDIARSHAARAVATIGFRARERRASWRDPAPETMLGLSALRPMQAALAAQPAGDRLLILESETGSGKTEAALLRFRTLFGEGAVDALYFALPTRSAAVQLHRRVSLAARAMFGQAFDAILAVPGYLTAGDVSGAPLGAHEVRWDDDPDAARRDARWAAEAPRRFLAAEVAVGTVDQVMLAALQAKWAHFRAAALSRTLLVIDEVHASDSYMTRILQQVLKAHCDLGGHALLMSATLGAAARARWLSQALPAPPEAERLPYPALSSRSDKGGPRPLPGAGLVKTVEMAVSQDIADPVAAAHRAVRAAASGGRVLVIRNTVDQAVATLRAIEAAAPDAALLSVGGVATLHHGRFASEDRRRLDAAVEAALSPHRGETTPGGASGVIVVGTQTLEQSLDIDADLLVTDLCPVDVLLQRIGRLHRQVRTPRPSAFTVPRCLVLSPPVLSPARGAHARFGLGPTRGGGVYPDIVGLEATRRLIRDHPIWHLPAMNRLLVERATHPTTLRDLARELGSEWEAARRTLEGADTAEAIFAGLRIVARHLTFDDTEAEVTVAFADVETEIQTRLGGGRVALSLDAAPTGPFGTPVTRIDVPVRFLQGIPPEALDDLRVSQISNGFDIYLGDKIFRYDRLGLREDRDA